jgi:hypothetical protein
MSSPTTRTYPFPHRADGADLEAVVYNTVAIIILAVAKFGYIRMDCRIFIVAIAAASRISVLIFVITFVDLAVAIVILPIANLHAFTRFNNYLAYLLFFLAIHDTAAARTRKTGVTRPDT